MLAAVAAFGAPAVVAPVLGAPVLGAPVLTKEKRVWPLGKKPCMLNKDLDSGWSGS